MQPERKPSVAHSTRPALGKLRCGDDLSSCIRLVAEKRCEGSFRRLYDHFSPRIRSFLRQKGLEDRLSQDMAQEVMTKIWLKADQFDPDKANAATWVFTIARNSMIDHVRKCRRAQVDPDDPLFVANDVEKPDFNLEKADRNKALRAAIRALPAEQAQVLRLVYIRGLKQQRVADELSIPLNTVKSRLRLSIEKLRRTLENT